MSRVDRSLRGAAAIVGVADDVSPTGELDRTGRELEVAMVLDALDDAGLTLADVDGVCHPESAVAFAEYLGLHPTFLESTMTGGSSYEVHVEHAVGREGHRPDPSSRSLPQYRNSSNPLLPLRRPGIMHTGTF